MYLLPLHTTLRDMMTPEVGEKEAKVIKQGNDKEEVAISTMTIGSQKATPISQILMVLTLAIHVIIQVSKSQMNAKFKVLAFLTQSQAVYSASSRSLHLLIIRLK